PGAGCRRGRRGAAVARARRTDPETVARARRGALLRDVLLRLGHALLPGKDAGRSGRQDTDRPRAGALLEVARGRAEAAPPPARGPSRGPRRASRCGRLEPDGGGWSSVRARGRHGDPAPASVRGERLAQRPVEPAAARAGARTRARRARPPLSSRHGRSRPCTGRVPGRRRRARTALLAGPARDAPRRAKGGRGPWPSGAGTGYVQARPAPARTGPGRPRLVALLRRPRPPGRSAPRDRAGRRGRPPRRAVGRL